MTVKRLLLCLLLVPSSLVAVPTAPDSGEPTLARATLWITEDRMEEFGAAFDELLVPLLREHGLVESDADAPETVEGVFSRLYEFDSPAALARKLVELQADPRLTEASRSLERDFESPREDGQLQPRFRILSSPAGPGRAVPAEPVSVSPLGAGRGTWRTFDVTNGLAGPFGDHGDLWIGTDGGGVSHFDGRVFQTLTVEDGLASNVALSVVLHEDGALWITSNKGVTRHLPATPSPPPVRIARSLPTSATNPSRRCPCPPV